MKLCIVTCDKTSWILKPFAFLLDKYCPELTDIAVLGYSVFPELPERYKIVSLSPKQNNINEWCINLYKYFNSIDDDYVLFGLDDVFPIRSIDYNVLNKGLSLIKNDSNIVRYELGIGHYWHGAINKIDDVFYSYGNESLYRISTQWAIWNREYLMEYLNHTWTPWEFETEGSKIASSDGKDVIATQSVYACEFDFSALSSIYEGMVNVAGVIREDVEEMISLGILERDKLQLGIKINSPKYE